MYCICCGAENNSGARFCAVCGAQLETPSATANASVAQSSATQPTQSPQSPAASTPPIPPAPVELSVDIDAIAQELDQDREGYHQLTAQILELERQFRDGRMTREVHDAARQRLVASRPDGESAAFDADLALLGERYARGEMSDSVYQIRLNELRSKRASQQTAQQAVANPNDTGSFGYAFLGFLFPIVGLILYLVWKDNKPLSAKAAGKGALVSVVVSVVIYILYFIFIAATLSSVTRYY